MPGIVQVARDRGAQEGARRHRLPQARPCAQRAGRQSHRRPEEAARAGPHHDGRCQGGAARRGGGRRQPHAAQRPCRQYRADEPGTGLHLLRHRARHGPDRAALRPGDRHGAGREDRRGPDGRNPRQSRRSSKPISAPRWRPRNGSDRTQGRRRRLWRRADPQWRQHGHRAVAISASSSGRTAPASRRRSRRFSGCSRSPAARSNFGGEERRQFAARHAGAQGASASCRRKRTSSPR